MSCSHADPGGDRGAGLGSDPFDRRAAETHLRPGTIMKHSGSSSRILSWRLPRSRENQFHFALSPVRRVYPSWGRGAIRSRCGEVYTVVSHAPGTRAMGPNPGGS